MPTAKKAISSKKPAAKKVAPAKKAVSSKKPAAKKAAPAKKRTPNVAFMRAMTPSAALAAIVGSTPLARTDVNQKVWEYIKKNKLQDKSKKTMINADAKLKDIFGKAQVSMFEIARLIGRNLDGKKGDDTNDPGPYITGRKR